MSDHREKTSAEGERYWEVGYGNPNVSTMGGPSSEVIEVAAALQPGANVLDLGCGEGRNSLYLATQGFKVTAVDLSKNAIAKLNHMSERAGVAVKTIVTDLMDLEFTEEYDAILAHGLPAWMKREDWQTLFARAREKTRPGGFNMSSAKYFTPEYPEAEAFRNSGFPHSVGPLELKHFYSDWEIVRYDRYVKWERHPGAPTHPYPMDKLVARKPGNPSAPPARIQLVPIKDRQLPEEILSKLEVGMSLEKVLGLCGEPDAVETFVAEGLQYGVFTRESAGGYKIHFYFFGRTMLEFVDGRMRSRNDYLSEPMRIHY
ncbi:methyltransferase domain-containing protein [Cystobacter fuscus]|uniref:methyltransferase domain-containing protein n=1 Tax=Cystobacter fuscus TaxID=43 RepID=UPI00097155D2|nr:methyltransferase domain-containing protein [Cystobacter fuscus]